MLSTFQESCLPAEARSHILVWTARMQQLTALGRGWTRQAGALAKTWGVGKATLVRYYYQYEAEGIMGLVDKRKFGKFLEGGAARGLPPAFVEFWKSLNERYQRNGGARQSYRVLTDTLKQWRRGNTASAIPGYDTPPVNQTGKLHPLGWSYENLLRHLPDQVELSFARQGRGAAKKYLPKVYTTRVGLEPGQVLMIDDQWYDVQVAWDNGQVARPLSFDLMCLASGYEILDGCMPRLETEDGKHMGLKSDDAWWLILAHLTGNGYRADIGTHIVVERGTATLRQEISEGLAHATGGKILVDKGGVDNRALRGLMFDGPAKGNFRFKASRESIFNLARNLIAALPGQTGRNRDEAPEEQGGAVSYVSRLLAKVPEERRNLLKLPILTEGQFISLKSDLKEALRNRTWHDLEGWEAMGHMQTMFRLPEWGDGEWVPIEQMQDQLLRLPPDRAELLALAMTAKHSDTPLIVTRKKSPQEVWDAGKHKLTKLSPWSWNVIMPGRMAHSRHVEDCREIRIYGLGPEIVRYDARAKSATGRDILLRPGDQVLVYVNPFAPDLALCCDTTGAAIGILSRIVPMVRIDQAAVLHRMGQVKQLTADIEAPVARRAESLAADRQEQKAHNDRVLKGLPVTSEEHERASRSKAVAKAAVSIFDHVIAPPLQAPCNAPSSSSPADYFDA